MEGFNEYSELIPNAKLSKLKSKLSLSETMNVWINDNIVSHLDTETPLSLSLGPLTAIRI